jgi:hypothetical protein
MDFNSGFVKQNLAFGQQIKILLQLFWVFRVLLFAPQSEPIISAIFYISVPYNLIQFE